MAITKLNSRSLSSGAVTTDLLASNAVTTAKIGVDVIVAEDIAANAITVSELAANAVTTVKVADGAITAAKLAADATIQKLSSAPSVGSEGTLYYNTTTDLLYLSNGTVWQPIDTNAPPVPTGGTVTIAAQSGLSTFSYNLGLNFTDELPDAELTYTLESGTLPAGAVLPSSGNTTLTGTATNTAATYNFVIRATDAKAAFATQAFTQTINLTRAATGGTITTYGSYKVHTFTSSGTFATNMATSIDFLVIAGGGGGGQRHNIGGHYNDGAGGAGAGGFLAFAGQTVNAGSLSVTVGAGGSSDTQGSNSLLTGFTTAVGGGKGGQGGYSGTNAAEAGGNGGSGGGGGGRNTGGTNPGGSGTSGQGNAGGTVNYTGQQAAGGGGAGAAGVAIYNANKDGGVGLVNNYRTGSNIYYAGGGGGGRDYVGYAGAGGNGGGAAGATGATPGSPGTANTGGGGSGGGAGSSSAQLGGAGGSGIVIIRYAV